MLLKSYLDKIERDVSLVLKACGVQVKKALIFWNAMD